MLEAGLLADRRRARRSGTAAAPTALSTSMSAGDDLDLAGGQVGVLVALGPAADLAGHLDARTRCAGRAPRLASTSSRTTTWATPRGVAQVEERHPAVIAPTGHPAGEGDGLSGVVGTQGAGLVGAEHGDVLFGVGVRSAPPSYGTPPRASNRLSGRSPAGTSSCPPTRGQDDVPASCREAGSAGGGEPLQLVRGQLELDRGGRVARGLGPRRARDRDDHR